jgi:hypothetical protein
MARSLANAKSDNKNVFIRVLSNGRTAKYKKSTNEFIIIHDGKFIGTYFKPTNGWRYFITRK